MAAFACICAIAGLAAAGCGRGKTAEQPPSTPDARPVDPGPVIDAGPPIDAGPAIVALSGSDSDERQALARSGAIPAWRAVVDRSRYLARREQRGAIYGRIGPQVPMSTPASVTPEQPPADAGAVSSPPAEPAPTRYWLIDETDGSGSLTVRLALPEDAPGGHPDDAVREGRRLVAWGAWRVDIDSQWYWQADELAWLGDRAWSVKPDERSVPGHVIVDIDNPPARAKTVSEIENRGGYITFEVVRASANPADGWSIADRSGDKPIARLYLPGERESYGAQNWRTPEEHWQLERGTRYVVWIKRFLPAKEGDVPLMRALDAPRRVVGKKRRK